jgi:hypothetical protein
MKTLAKYHAPLAVTQNPPGSGTWSFTPGFTGFNDGYREAGAPSGFFVSETYFDLAGMAMDEKTLIFEGMATQTPGNSLFTAGAAGDSCVVYDIMTSIPVNFDLASTRSALLNHGLGFPAGTLNFEHVLYQRRRRYTLDLDTAAAFLLNAEDDQSGSMMPTASDRIYSYRVVQFYDVSGTVAAASVTGARHLLQAQAKEEPTYEYLMRLKRSYDLQQSHDED